MDPADPGWASRRAGHASDGRAGSGVDRLGPAGTGRGPIPPAGVDRRLQCRIEPLDADASPVRLLPGALADLLRQRLADTASDAVRDRWFEATRLAVESRVADVVGGLRRRLYAHAAELIVASAEALALRGERDRADPYVAATRRTYSRHFAFRAALDGAVASSPILGTEPAGGQRQRVRDG